MEEKKQTNKVLQIAKDIVSPNLIVVIIILMLSSGIGRGMYTTGLNLYAGKFLGLTPNQLSLAATIGFIATVVFRPVGSKLADHPNIKLMTVITGIVTGIVACVAGFATGFVVYTIGRCLFLAISAVYGNVATTAGTFSSNRKYMGTNAAILAFFPSLLSAIAVFYSRKIFNDTLNTRPGTVFFIVGAVFVISVIPIVLFNMKDPKVKARQEEISARKVRAAAEKKASGINGWLFVPAIPIVISTFFIQFVMFAVEIIAVYIGLDRGIDAVVFWMGGIGIFKVVGSLAGGVLADVFKKAKFTLPPCLILASLACVILIFADSPILITVAGAIYGFARTAAGPVIRKVALAITPDDRRGATLSTTSLMVDIAGIFGSALAGLLVTGLGSTGALWVTAAFPIVGLVCFVLSYKKIKEAEDILYGNKEAQPAEGGK